MSGLNKVMLIGNLCRDPELKEVSGTAICKFSLATSKEWKGDDGDKNKKTEFHNIVCFRKTAELAGKYLSKGKKVYVEGEIQTRSWDDKDTGAKKYMTEIVANNIQFLSEPKERSHAGEDASSSAQIKDFETNEVIPF